MKCFSEKVYGLCKRIPKGKVTTYKEIAHYLGTKGYRAVGQALKCNPYAPLVPCHRIVRSDGLVGGFKGKIRGEEIKEKVKLLKEEGVKVKNNKVDMLKYKFRFV